MFMEEWTHANQNRLDLLSGTTMKTITWLLVSLNSICPYEIRDAPCQAHYQ
jgi:hypothetical protein